MDWPDNNQTSKDSFNYFFIILSDSLFTISDSKISLKRSEIHFSLNFHWVFTESVLESGYGEINI